MKTILISFVALLFGTTIFSENNDYLNLMNLRFDLSEDDIYQDLLNF
jgi:hypothetical protein